MDEFTPTSIDGLIQKTSLYLEDKQVKKIIVAFKFAKKLHRGQIRKSGGDYIWHPVAVAEILAEIQLDCESIVAALLHDIIEDTPISKVKLKTKFGESITEIVDGVTKLGKLEFDNPQEAQAENFRKMIMAMARDIRVILIKLADRLHNMRTLNVMRLDKQRRIAIETLDIYAPIAARLGINAIRLELEDLGFKAMYPLRHKVLELAVKNTKGHRHEIVNKIAINIERRLQEENIPAQVIGREKHLYSLYKKMKYKKLRFDDILDIFAFRVIVNTADQCYRALGSTHSLYKPFPGRIKDYIAIPKPNGYQSLHTVLFGSFGGYIEVQIRTKEMNEVSEHGIAAHWVYKKNPTKDTQNQIKNSPVEIRAQEWVKNLLEMQQSAGNSLDFLESVKIDLFPSVIYLFTPNGDIVTLPIGATAIDFAYAVHTSVGHSAIGCRVNKKLIPLRSKLESGQTIEIMRSEEKQPNPAWLQVVITAKARSQIRAFLKKQQHTSAIKLGKRLLKKSLLTYSMKYKSLTGIIQEDLIDKLNIVSWKLLLEDIGHGKRFANLVAKQIHDLVLGSENNTFVPSKTAKNATPLTISGTEGMVVNYAGCCYPILGDDIIGFISAEKGLVIHRQECNSVKNFKNNPDKWLDVHWGTKIQQLFNVGLQIEVENSRGALAKIATEISAEKSDIERITSEDKDESYSLMNLIIKVNSRKHLAGIMRQLRNMSIVEKIHRV